MIRSLSWHMGMLKRAETKAKVRARRIGKYKHVAWA